ncbi:MAG TPA: hypothetical protein VFZ66_07400, partial [Herpetosiphonaceae bacterium]
ISGSALGVIIDARPRPLTLPDDLTQRRTMLLGWMEALGALPPVTAFAPTKPSEKPAAPTNGAQTGVELPAQGPAIARPEAPSAPVGTLSSGEDVAALREGLMAQPPQKRGFFRRK